MIGSLLIVTSLFVGQSDSEEPGVQSTVEKGARKGTVDKKPTARDAAEKDKEKAEKGNTEKGNTEKGNIEKGNTEKGDLELATKVRKLVKQLDGSSVADRDAAEKALIELGPDVLNHLPRVTSRDSAETKVRLGRVATTLEKKLSETLVNATLVTMHGEMTISEALAALEKQTGNRIVAPAEGGDRKITLELEKATYWEAVDQLLDRAELGLDPFGGENNALTLASREGAGTRLGKASYVGLFRVEASRLEAVRDLRGTEGGLRIRLDVAWEPRLTPISIAQPLADLTAVDENGKAIEATNTEGVRSGQGQRNISSVEMDLPFSLPSRDSKKIASLKGKLMAVLPGRVETFEWKDLNKQSVLRKAGVVVTLEGFEENGDVFEARLRVVFAEGSNALESFRNWISNNEAYLVDKSGQRLENLGHELSGRDGNEVGLRYLFDPDREEIGSYKLVYRTPAMIVRLPVEYELKDIELP